MPHRHTGRITGSRLLASAGILLALVVPQPSSAYKIYKSVDAAGNVTYSTYPTVDAKRVESVKLRAGPTDEQQAQAKAREQAIATAADQVSEELETTKAEREAGVQASQTEVIHANDRLEEALEHREDDWQGTVSGHRRLKESYFLRVEKARVELERAREKLAAARKAQRQ